MEQAQEVAQLVREEAPEVCALRRLDAHGDAARGEPRHADRARDAAADREAPFDRPHEEDRHRGPHDAGAGLEELPQFGPVPLDDREAFGDGSLEAMLAHLAEAQACLLREDPFEAIEGGGELRWAPFSLGRPGYPHVEDVEVEGPAGRAAAKRDALGGETSVEDRHETVAHRAVSARHPKRWGAAFDGEDGVARASTVGRVEEQARVVLEADPSRRARCP